MKNYFAQFYQNKILCQGRHNQNTTRVKTLLFQASFLHAYHWCSIVSKLTTTSINLNQQSFIWLLQQNSNLHWYTFFLGVKNCLFIYIKTNHLQCILRQIIGHGLHRMQYLKLLYFHKIICNGITMQMFDSNEKNYKILIFLQ
jgi:hypothetical protein